MSFSFLSIEQESVGLDLSSIYKSISLDPEDFYTQFQDGFRGVSQIGIEEMMGQALLKILLYLPIQRLDESIMDILRRNLYSFFRFP